MALDSGPLPVATPDSVARTDFNNAMAQLDAAFPLQNVNIANPLRMAIGTFVGDGENNRPIIGVGFQPKAVLVYLQLTGGNGIFLKTYLDGTSAGAANLGLGIWVYEAGIIPSLDPDGFTVSPGQGMNETGWNYIYIALG